MENENARNYHFRRQSNRPKLGRVCKSCGMGMDILELAKVLERFFNAAYAAGAEANGRSPLAFDALHECADLMIEGYEK